MKRSIRLFIVAVACVLPHVASAQGALTVGRSLETALEVGKGAEAAGLLIKTTESAALIQISHVNPCLPSELGEAAKLTETIDEAAKLASLSEPMMGVTELTTSLTKARRIRALAEVIAGDQAPELEATFWRAVARAKAQRNPEVQAWLDTVPENWFEHPSYELYPQYFGTPTKESAGTFDTTSGMFDYLDWAGFHNVSIRPHYESRGLDGGYDVSSFTPAEGLGGQEGFERMLDEARQKGIRVIVDFPGNHVSTEHPWFQAAVDGDSKYLDYFVTLDDWTKVGEVDEGGDIKVIYENTKTGEQWKETLIFPDVKRDHLLRRTVNGENKQFFHSFYPFQVDLNLRNPDVVGSQFEILGELLNEGVLGIRMDAMAHWIKIPGKPTDGHFETHALQALFKAFVEEVSPKAALIPEVVRYAGEANRYYEDAELVRYLLERDALGHRLRTLEGDGLYNFEHQAAVLEGTYFQTSEPLWEKIFSQPRRPARTVWFNYQRHHDEAYIGNMRRQNWEYLRNYINGKEGIVYKNGMSAGGRNAHLLNEDPDRIATGFFVQYMLNGAPAVYYGDEIGALNNVAHAEAEAERVAKGFAEMGYPIDADAALDPRQLQRGTITADTFREAQTEEYLPLMTVRALNDLWVTRASVRTNYMSNISNGHDEVFSFVRVGDGDAPLLGLANLSHEPKTVRIPLDELHAKMCPSGLPSRADDILGEAVGNRPKPVSFTMEDGNLVIELAPYDRMLLDIRFMPE